MEADGGKQKTQMKKKGKESIRRKRKGKKVTQKKKRGQEQIGGKTERKKGQNLGRKEGQKN